MRLDKTLILKKLFVGYSTCLLMVYARAATFIAVSHYGGHYPTTLRALLAAPLPIVPLYYYHHEYH